MIKIGLYGNNGHQIQDKLSSHSDTRLIATAAFYRSLLTDNQREYSREYPTLEEMLLDKEIDLISLCSPVRQQQAQHAIKCLKAGKNVYAEKPCAVTEQELDDIIKTAKETGLEFHEMAGTAFEEPYLSIRKKVASGIIGEVIQVFAQKSYPYHDKRPQDESVDGGLICQNGIHAVRFIEHVAGKRVNNIFALETALGNPVENGGLKMAASYLMDLEKGGVASIIANYLNQPGFHNWGNEQLRIFGEKGFVEAVDGGQRTRLVVGKKDYGELGIKGEGLDYFDLYISKLLGNGVMPLALEEELHPTRIVIRAKLAAKELLA